MSHQALSSVVDQARITASRVVPDADLLERFLRTRDEAAFAALVRRHRPMVFAACRQVLIDDADVEDAAQQTFLALWRNVRSIRNTQAVGGWLFGVAHRIAVKGLATSRRRSEVEGRASASRSEVGPPPDISWREACVILHEELDRLADKHRLPLLLCYLDGKSREEAAKQLGWSPGAVKGHLQRGRIRLRDRLARRGVSLSAGLLAAVVGARATAGTSIPVASILNAVMSMSHRRVAGLTTGVRALFGLALLVTCMAAGVGVRVAMPAADESDKATSPLTPPLKAAADAETVTLSGQVHRPDGTPAAGAKIYSCHANAEPMNAEKPYAVTVRGTTDGEGRFRVDVPKADVGLGVGGDWLPIIAGAEGFGIDWAAVRDPRQQLTLRLVPDQPIDGRVIDSEGRPVAKATVRVTALHTTFDEKLDVYLAVARTEGRNSLAPLTKRLYEEVAPTRAQTDANGRFRIAGVGRERLVMLEVTAPAIARETVFVVTRAGFDPSTYNRVDNSFKPDVPRRPDFGPPLHGPKLDFVATPGKIVEGTVLSTDGTPIAGARVAAAGWAVIAQKTDAAGRFRLTGIRKQPSYNLFVDADKQSTYLHQSFPVSDSEGLQPIRVELRMVRGVVLTGRVLDSQTGAGVHAALQFVPLPANAYYCKPGYETYRRTGGFTVTTGPDGSYRLPILPGLGVLMCQARGPVGPDGQLVSPYLLASFDEEDRKRVEPAARAFVRYFRAADGQIEALNNANFVKVLELPPDAAPTTVDVQVRRGKTASLIIQDPEGRALTGAVAGGMLPAPTIQSPLSKAECTLQALEAEGREVIIYHPGRDLAKRLTVRGDATEPATVRLEPTATITGRVLDVDGKPVAAVEVLVRLLPSVAGIDIGNFMRRHLPPVRTDADGRFRLTGVIPELKVGFNLRLGQTYLIGKPPIDMQEVKPGATLDLGDFRTESR
jgi:RNA polymerase sigma factor (sigma-70 family)